MGAGCDVSKSYVLPRPPSVPCVWFKMRGLGFSQAAMLPCHGFLPSETISHTDLSISKSPWSWHFITEIEKRQTYDLGH